MLDVSSIVELPLDASVTPTVIALGFSFVSLGPSPSLYQSPLYVTFSTGVTCINISTGVHDLELSEGSDLLNIGEV